MEHYDYVLLPNGKKAKIVCAADIDSVQAEWQDYIQDNWLSQSAKKLFDPESKVKFMLDGLANIILRRNGGDGAILTEYQKMKIGKYEIPLSSCASLLGDEFYSERPKLDNGEEESKMRMLMDELARKYDEALAAKGGTSVRPKKERKNFPPTRRQCIETVRHRDDIVEFVFATVDTDNGFVIDGRSYRIPSAYTQYGPKSVEGDSLYDMDKIICGRSADGTMHFYDMNIEEIEVL